MASISRRGFVTGSLAAAAILKYGRPAFAQDAPKLNQEPQKVAPGALKKIPDIVDIKGEDVKQMVAEVIAALGGIATLVSGKNVVLKANSGFANPAEWATTTNPDVVAAVAQQCKDAGARSITLVEFPQGDAGAKCFDRCGMRAALTPIGVRFKVLDPNKEKDFFEADKDKDVPRGSLERKGLMFSALCKSAEVLINLPVAKSHADTGVSFGLKNFMGLIKDRRAFHDANIQQCIADLAAYVQLVSTPAFTILDATRVLKTGGPQGPGEVGKEGRLIAGVMTATVDAYALDKLDIASKGKASHIDLALALKGAPVGRKASPGNILRLPLKK